MMKAFGMCLNWKVIGGLAALLAGIFLFAPQLALAALPFAFLAVCPLSMMLMMGGMNRMNGNASTAGMEGSSCATDRKPVPAQPVPAVGRAEQVAQLRAQLEEVRARQAAIAGQLASLDETGSRRPSAASVGADTAKA